MSPIRALITWTATIAVITMIVYLAWLTTLPPIMSLEETERLFQAEE